MMSSTVAFFMLLLDYEDRNDYDVSIVERKLVGLECLCWLLVVFYGRRHPRFVDVSND
jgi:hypothetical protein